MSAACTCEPAGRTATRSPSQSHKTGWKRFVAANTVVASIRDVSIEWISMRQWTGCQLTMINAPQKNEPWNSPLGRPDQRLLRKDGIVNFALEPDAPPLAAAGMPGVPIHPPSKGISGTGSTRPDPRPTCQETPASRPRLRHHAREWLLPDCGRARRGDRPRRRWRLRLDRCSRAVACAIRSRWRKPRPCCRPARDPCRAITDPCRDGWSGCGARSWGGADWSLETACGIGCYWQS